ncbi:MAG: glutathione S-transferase N-terminal domain-containing protein [Pseudomonadota bacterium]
MTENATLPGPVLLYTQMQAPNPQRVAMFLAEKGLEIPTENVDLLKGEQKTEAYRAAVGAAVVPALRLENGTVLTETPAICRYLEALCPEPNLMGRDPLEIAEIEMWQRRVELGLFTAVAQCFRHTNPRLAVMEEQVAEWGEVNRGRIDGHLRALDERLAGRDWLAADRMTIADLTAYLATGFQRIIKHPMPEGLEALAAWRARMADTAAGAAIARKKPAEGKTA